MGEATSVDEETVEEGGIGKMVEPKVWTGRLETVALGAPGKAGIVPLDPWNGVVPLKPEKPEFWPGMVGPGPPNPGMKGMNCLLAVDCGSVDRRK